MQIHGLITICCLLGLSGTVSGCPKEPYCVRGPYGTNYGHKFHDFELYMSTTCHNITRIEVWHDTIVQGLKITYGSSASDLRGSATGSHENHEIQTEQYITKVEGHVGSTDGDSTHRITGITFHKSDGSTLGPYGGQGVDQEAFVAIGTHDNKAGLAWVSGRAGSNLDQLTFSYNCDL